MSDGTPPTPPDPPPAASDPPGKPTPPDPAPTPPDPTPATPDPTDETVTPDPSPTGSSPLQPDDQPPAPTPPPPPGPTQPTDSGPGPQPGPGWWLASDGKWYPPDQQPGYAPQGAFTQQGMVTQQGMAQPGYLVYDPQAKSKVTAGLLGIFLGGFGIHRFYLGYTQIGVIQIVVTILTCGFGSIWGFVEGILILVGNEGFRTDAEGRPLRE